MCGRPAPIRWRGLRACCMRRRLRARFANAWRRGGGWPDSGTDHRVLWSVLPRWSTPAGQTKETDRRSHGKLWLVWRKPHGARIGLEQERLAARPGAQQLAIFTGAEIARPHDAGRVDIGGVPDPLLLEDVERRDRKSTR